MTDPWTRSPDAPFVLRRQDFEGKYDWREEPVRASQMKPSNKRPWCADDEQRVLDIIAVWGDDPHARQREYPVLMFHNGKLIDGYHRMVAWKRLRLREPMTALVAYPIRRQNPRPTVIEPPLFDVGDRVVFSPAGTAAIEYMNAWSVAENFVPRDWVGLVLNHEYYDGEPASSYKVKWRHRAGHTFEGVFKSDQLEVLPATHPKGARAYPPKRVSTKPHPPLREWRRPNPRPNGRPVPVLSALRPALAAAAQRVYDEWVVEDPEDDELAGGDDLAGGGICDLIADAMVLALDGFEATTVLGMHGEQHISVVARAPAGVWAVDIDPGVYETGGGFAWKKIEGVTFEPDDVDITLLDRDLNSWGMYADGDG